MNKLREWRLARPDIQTLDAAGRALGVSGVQFYRYETGARKIAPQSVLRVSEITGISPHELRPDVFDVFTSPPAPSLAGVSAPDVPPPVSASGAASPSVTPAHCG
jgi:hypothetical protein